jgi:hypothetical protein
MEAQITMARRWFGAILRWVAAAVMGLGVVLFTAGAWFGFVALREGVTGLVGEGDRLPLESPEQVRLRLISLGGCLGGIVCGWLLARLGDVFQRPDPQSPGLGRLPAELLFLLGGIGLATGLLVWCGPRAGAYEASEAYRRLGTIAAASGPVCLCLGWVLLRKSARHSNLAEPGPGPDRGSS